MGSFISTRNTIAAAVLGLGLFVAAPAADAAVIVVLDDVTRPGDPIVGVSNTGAGGPNVLATVGTADLQYPTFEGPTNAIDNDVTKKYLNFGETSVGFVVTPSAGPSTVVGLRIATANDRNDRDPISFTLEGSNDANAAAAGNDNWELISHGLTGLTVDPGRLTFQPDSTLALFFNDDTYSSYRLLFTAVRDGAAANSMQVGEVELLVVVVPEPASIGLLGAGAIGLLKRRRR